MTTGKKDRPKGWDNPFTKGANGEENTSYWDFEAGADAYEELIKKDALYGESGEDFLIATKVKLENRGWAEPFFKTLEGKGHLVFIKEG